MTENAPTGSLTKIHADIAHADEEAKESRGINVELMEKAKELFEQAAQILREYGEVRQKSVGRGAGGNIIGFRSETESYLETPVATVEFEGKKADLVLSEDFTSHPGYLVTKDKIVLQASFDQDSVLKNQFFLINRDGGTQDWLGKPATMEQMDMIKGILSLMKDSLPKVNRQREVRVNLPLDLKGFQPRS